MQKPLGDLQGLLRVLVKLHTKSVASFASRFDIPLSALKAVLSGRMRMSERIQNALLSSLAIADRGFDGLKIESWLVKDAADVAELLALGVVLKPLVRIKTSTEAAGKHAKQAYMLWGVGYGATERFAIARMSFKVLEALHESLDTEAGEAYVLIDSALSPELHDVSEPLTNREDDVMAGPVSVISDAQSFVHAVHEESLKRTGYLDASRLLSRWMSNQRSHRLAELIQGAALPKPFTLKQIHDLAADAYALQPMDRVTRGLAGTRNDGALVEVRLVVVERGSRFVSISPKQSSRDHFIVVRKIGDYGFECLFQGPFEYVDAMLQQARPQDRGGEHRFCPLKLLFEASKKVKFEELLQHKL